MCAGYITANMLVPGQVEKWVSIADTNQFSIARLPVNMFRQAHGELSNNFVECGQKAFVINLTWFQHGIAKFLQGFLDEETRSKQVFSQTVCPPELTNFVHRSQLQ